MLINLVIDNVDNIFIPLIQINIPHHTCPIIINECRTTTRKLSLGFYKPIWQIPILGIPNKNRLIIIILDKSNEDEPVQGIDSLCHAMIGSDTPDPYMRVRCLHSCPPHPTSDRV
jgi:hypothetical protein